jgi:hypothetical protein
MKKIASMFVMALVALALTGCDCEKECGGCCGEDGACCKASCETSCSTTACSSGGCDK